MALADDLQAVAASVLAEFGYNATLNRKSARAVVGGPVYQPTYGAAPTVTVRVYTWDEKAKDANGVHIMKKKVLISGATTAPDEHDTLTIGSTDFELAELETIALQGTSVVFQATLVG